MVIGVLKEVKANEFRVAAVPATVTEMVRHGHTVYVETGAGVGSGFSDADYEAAGAVIADADTVWEKADLYYKVKELFPQEYKWMNKDKILFTYIHSNAHPEETDVLLNSHVSAAAYEDVQDKNGRFPLLRPMSELAGKGGFLAALHFAQSVNGGSGKLLANVTGVDTPVVTIIGCGNVGLGAAAFGNEVRILDVSMDAMLAAKKTMPNNVTFMISNRANLVKCLKEKDVHISGLLADLMNQKPVTAEDFAALEGKILLILPDQDFFSGEMQADLIKLMHKPQISYVSGGHLSTVLKTDDYIRTIRSFLPVLMACGGLY